MGEKMKKKKKDGKKRMKKEREEENSILGSKLCTPMQQQARVDSGGASPERFLEKINTSFSVDQLGQQEPLEFVVAFEDMVGGDDGPKGRDGVFGGDGELVVRSAIGISADLGDDDEDVVELGDEDAGVEGLRVLGKDDDHDVVADVGLALELLVAGLVGEGQGSADMEDDGDVDVEPGVLGKEGVAGDVVEAAQEGGFGGLCVAALELLERGAGAKPVDELVEVVGAVLVAVERRVEEVVVVAAVGAVGGVWVGALVDVALGAVEDAELEPALLDLGVAVALAELP